jgi:lipopolysaccharide transport system permease protein
MERKIIGVIYGKTANYCGFLSRRDLSVRYKQTAIGAGWAVIRPFATMTVMVFVFSMVGRFKGDEGIPYPLMVLAGITIWNFFSSTFTQISHSILLNSNLVTKTYFPRLIMPLSSVVVGFVDFFISIALFALIALWFKHSPWLANCFISCFSDFNFTSFVSIWFDFCCNECAF